MPMGASELAKVEDLGQAGPTWVIEVLLQRVGWSYTP